jgi:hypothetical protein
MQALVATGGTGVAKSAIPAMPDLRYNYLRVEVEGHPPAMLVLGYLAPHPLGQIEVWYSGNRETIRTQNGRVVGSTGTFHDWHAVGFTPFLRPGASCLCKALPTTVSATPCRVIALALPSRSN